VILPVKERGQFVATMRYIQVWLMETLARWVPTTPEMEVKLLFGEHIWDVAQHADALGKRTFELRLPLQHSVKPATAYADLLAELESTGPTPQRVAAIYDVMIPALVGRYRRYLSQTDALSDAPTVRIFERFFVDATRMIDAARSLRAEFANLQPDAAWLENLKKREAVLEPADAASTPAVAAA
jgi:hypothetical protein